MKLLHIPQFRAFVFTSILGTFLHFLYDLSGQNPLIALISAINESTWEHMKLLFWPLFLAALVQRRFFREQAHYWCVKLAQILLGLALIPVLFYTWNGVFGRSPDWVNISIFYITAALVFLFERWAFGQGRLNCGWPQAAFAGICLIGVLFVLFTFAPPQIPLFRDPITGTYGLKMS